MMDVLKRLRMLNCKETPASIVIGSKLSKENKRSNVHPTLFKRLVGSLMHLTTNTLDIMCVVSLISRFVETPKDMHWQVGKRILRYIVGTVGHGIL
jgi:hypothetical protein